MSSCLTLRLSQPAGSLPEGFAGGFQRVGATGVVHHHSKQLGDALSQLFVERLGDVLAGVVVPAYDGDLERGDVQSFRDVALVAGEHDERHLAGEPRPVADVSTVVMTAVAATTVDQARPQLAQDLEVGRDLVG